MLPDAQRAKAAPVVVGDAGLGSPLWLDGTGKGGNMHHKHTGKRSRNTGQKRSVVNGMARYTFYNPNGSKLAIAYQFDNRRMWRMVSIQKGP